MEINITSPLMVMRLLLLGFLFFTCLCHIFLTTAHLLIGFKFTYQVHDFASPIFPGIIHTELLSFPDQ